MKKLIEMVCTGNNGRSPVAELIARNHLIAIGADSEFDASSSGLMVDRTASFLAGEIRDDPDTVNYLIGIAVNSGVYSPDLVKVIECAKENPALRLRYAIDASEMLMKAEVEHRDKILREIGIPGQIKPGKDQTIARPDTVVVLAMDRRGLEGVGKIYAGGGYNPVTDTLPRYATGEDREVVNAFGKDIEAYRAAVEQLVREVPLAVDRAVGA